VFSVADLTGPDEDGATAVATIRESLSNVNVAAVNMADETEALKHNFLLRGFFRKRGYYTLTALSPDMYRKDPLFAAQNTDRAWLPADQLFHPDSHDVEELTSPGRSALRAAFGNYGQRVFQGPVVVKVIPTARCEDVPPLGNQPQKIVPISFNSHLNATRLNLLRPAHNLDTSPHGRDADILEPNPEFGG
jgi:hypothetical protein